MAEKRAKVWEMTLGWHYGLLFEFLDGPHAGCPEVAAGGNRLQAMAIRWAACLPYYAWRRRFCHLSHRSSSSRLQDTDEKQEKARMKGLIQEIVTN